MKNNYYYCEALDEFISIEDTDVGRTYDTYYIVDGELKTKKSNTDDYHSFVFRYEARFYIRDGVRYQVCDNDVDDIALRELNRQYKDTLKQIVKEQSQEIKRLKEKCNER